MNGENGGAYDPERFLRSPKTADSTNSNTDSAGRPDKHQTHAIQLHLSDQPYLSDGVHAMQYGGEIGWPWMNHEGTVIEIPSSGRVRCKEGWRSGEWLITVKGERLGLRFDHIAQAKQPLLRPTGHDVPKDKPAVYSIMVEPMPEEEE